MKKLILLFVLLLSTSAIFAQFDITKRKVTLDSLRARVDDIHVKSTAKFYEDVILYGDIDAGYLVVDSISINGQKIRYVDGDSIPGYAWVRNEISDSLAAFTVYSFLNGLTESGGEVKIGGTIEENTTVEVTDGNYFYMSGQGTKRFRKEGATPAQFAQLVLVDPAEGDVGFVMQANDGVGGGKFLVVSDYNAKGIEVTDNIASIGLQYDGDYSTNGLVLDRWVPDIAAVRAEINDSIQANPGAASLNELSDVSITGVQDGEILQYTLGSWTNQTANFSPWADVPGGISYDNSVTVGDSLKLKGGIYQNNTQSLVNGGEAAFYFSNDTIEVGENLTSNSYAYGERLFSRVDNTGVYDASNLNYWAYSRDSKLYTDAETYYGAYYNSAAFNAGVSGFMYGIANYSKAQFTDGGTHTIDNYYGFYNGTRGIQGGSSQITINEYAGIYNEFNVSVGVAGGSLTSNNVYGIYNELIEDADITHNITNAYGLWIGGTFNRADNTYGIYEDFAPSYFTNNVTFNDTIKGTGNQFFKRTRNVVSSTNYKLRESIDTFRLAETLTGGSDLYYHDVDILVDSNAFVPGNNLDFWSTKYDIEVREDVRTTFGLDFSNKLVNADANTSIVGARFTNRAEADGVYRAANTVNKFYGLRSNNYYFLENAGVHNNTLTLGIEQDFRTLGTGGTFNSTDVYGIKNTFTFDGDVTHNITNLYGLHISGAQQATNQYGIYEALGQNYLGSYTEIDDSLLVKDNATIDSTLTINHIVYNDDSYQDFVLTNDGSNDTIRLDLNKYNYFHARAATGIITDPVRVEFIGGVVPGNFTLAIYHNGTDPITFDETELVTSQGVAIPYTVGSSATDVFIFNWVPYLSKHAVTTILKVY